MFILYFSFFDDTLKIVLYIRMTKIMTMYEIPRLKKPLFLVIFVIFISILVIGLILLGLGYNLAFYNSDPIVQAVYMFFTETGSDLFYVAALSLIYLTFDKRYARFIIPQFIIQLFFNTGMKDIFQDPRPDWNIVNGVPIEDSFGFPSGHSQLAVSFWGMQMYMLQDHPKKKYILPILAIFLIFVPISRMVIGVHDLEDVIGGLLIGIGIATAYAYLAPEIMSKTESKSWKWKLSMSLLISIILWVISLVIAFNILDSEKAAENIAQPCGLLVALAFGLKIEENLIKYEIEEGNPKKNIILGVIGVLIIFVGYFVLGALFSFIPLPLWISRFIRYILIGTMIALVAPLILKKLQPKF
jgi:membrane-associated phospholipid phosphatase